MKMIKKIILVAIIVIAIVGITKAKKNKIVYNEGDFTDDQDLMFYTHCEYFIQAKGLNDKIEKMRGN